MFERDSGSGTDEAVFVVEVRPGDFDSFGRGFAVEGFELVAQFAKWGFPGAQIDGVGVFLALLGDAIEAGLNSATTDGEVHRAVVRMNEEIGGR